MLTASTSPPCVQFAIVLVDFTRKYVLLATDVFSTKPLWYAMWPITAGSDEVLQFAAASYESVLHGLGAPHSARKMAEPNEVLLLDFRADWTSLQRLPLVQWDLWQHKTDTCDWIKAFEEAVRVRSSGVKHKMFIGLSSGYEKTVLCV